MTIDASSQIPAPHYTLIETSKGHDPAIVVVNSALRTFQHRDRFPWHLNVRITCQLLGDNGMPTSEENQVLYKLEDEIFEQLLLKENAIFLSRVTCRGERELAYRVHDPKTAANLLSRLVANTDQLRQWGYRMEYDLDWVLAKPELALLERDPRFN